MKMNRKSQVGASMITWMAGIGLFVLMTSGVVKVVPLYIEFNSVKVLMKTIASEPDIKNADKRQIKRKIAKHLDINNLSRLEKSISESGGKKSGKKGPFKIAKLKKGNKRKLSVEYSATASWISNLSFLVNFKHSVILGEPDNTTGQ